MSNEQKPVAWIQPRTLDGHLRPDLGYETCSESDYGAFPVYTSPPKLVPLTQDEIIDATEHIDTSRDGYFIDIARAVERALEEKNRGR